MYTLIIPWALLVFALWRFVPCELREVKSRQYFRRKLTDGVTPLPIKVVTVFSTNGSIEIDRNIQMNPNWTFRVFNETEARDFIDLWCPAYTETYDGLLPISFKSDVFRYCALFTYGGVYMDDDLLTLVPLDSFLLVKDSLILVDEQNSGSITGFMGATVREHPMFTCCLEIVLDNVRHKRMHFPNKETKLAVSGPGVLTTCAPPPRVLRYNHHRDAVETIQGDIVILHKAYAPAISRLRSHYSQPLSWYA
jgi:hypothetical protein